MAGPDGEGVDYFAVLGLGPDADAGAVRRAFRVRARDTHPDRGGDAEDFMRVNEAYEALRTPQRRALAARAVREQRRRGARPTGPAGAPAASATSPGTSARRDPPPTARRLAEQEQDRLVQEFFRSHPAAGPPGPGTGSPIGRPSGVPEEADTGPAPARRGRRGALGLALAAVVGAAMAVVLLLPDLLPGPLGEWVRVVTG